MRRVTSKGADAGVRAEAPGASSLRVLSHHQRVINLNAQVPDRTLNFGVPK